MMALRLWRSKISMNQPTPAPSKEGSKTADARRQFPSWEGSGVGSWSRCAILKLWMLPMNRTAAS